MDCPEEGYIHYIKVRKENISEKAHLFYFRFVLRLAQETEGIIVSNDNYRDLWHEKQEWRQLIEDRCGYD